MRIHAGLVYLKLQKMMQDCGEELSPLASEKSSKSMSIIIQMSRSLSMVILRPYTVNKQFGNHMQSRKYRHPINIRSDKSLQNG